MANDWDIVRFGSLYKEPSRNGLTKPKKIRGKGIKFINMGEIFAHDRILNVEADRATLNDKELENSLLNPYDLLFARQSLVLSGAGKCSIFIGDEEPVSFESHLIRVRLDSEKVIPLYYYYYFRSPHGKSAIYSITEQGAGASGIRGSDLVDLPVICPPKHQQRVIAHILGSLDDKIELNRKMNQTLEAMARAIFKSWFVDFDPVRENMKRKDAKAQGREDYVNDDIAASSRPGVSALPSEILDLFPDSFEESEMGEVPRGWEVGTLKDISILEMQTVQPKKYPQRIWEYYSIPAFDEGKQPHYEKGENIKSGKYIVPNYSVLASKLNPQFPRVWLPDLHDSETSICSTEFMPFVPINKEWRPFLYELLKSQPVQSEISNRVTGSTGSRQRVKPKDIAELPCIVPPQKLIEVFCQKVGSMHSKKHSNIRESSSLAKIRDLLLPKLISGELRVPDAEELVV